MSKKQLFLAKYGSLKHIDDALNNADFDVRETAILHPNATKEHIDKALNDDDFIKQHVSKNPKLNPEHINRLLTNTNTTISRNLVEHPNTTKEQLENFSKHESRNISNIAKDRLERHRYER